MLLAEIEVWQVLAGVVAALTSGGAGILGKYLYDIWRTRQADREKAVAQTRTWQKEDRKDTHDYLLEIIAQWKADYARMQERVAADAKDHQERIREVEKRQYISEVKEGKCQIRLTRAEVEIRNFHFAAERYNELLPAGIPKFLIRKYDPEDDSELEDPPVQPHGPKPEDQ